MATCPSIYAMGNALLDIEYHVSEDFLQDLGIQKGAMSLVDDVVIESVKTKLCGEAHHVACGGSAANTVATACYCGSSVYLSCRVADDESGHAYYDNLKNSGIASNLDERLEGNTGTCMVLITPDGERTMLSYLGVAGDFSSQDVRTEELKKAQYLFIEGYLITSEKAREAANSTKTLAQSLGVKTVLSLSDPQVVEHFHSYMDSIVGKHTDIIFCNEWEARAFAKTDCLERAKQCLAKRAESVLITMGPEGSWLGVHGEWKKIAAYNSKQRLNSLGAGDTFAGSYLYAITQGKTPYEAADFASFIAAHVVAQPGPRLSQQQLKDLVASHPLANEAQVS